MTYAARLKAALSTAERRVLAKLSTPKKIQNFLDTLPIHFVKKGEGIFSPRTVLQKKKAHCMEGAVLAAAALAYHGARPLLMDFQTTQEDEDHVLAVFKQGGHWGAISKTNHPVLRWRDPVYRSVRELAMSYFHEYFMWQKSEDGRKTLRTYSKPFDLRTYTPERWAAAEKNLDWLAEVLDASPHYPIVPKKTLRALRPASKIEMRAMRLCEWPKK